MIFKKLLFLYTSKFHCKMVNSFSDIPVPLLKFGLVNFYVHVLLLILIFFIYLLQNHEWLNLFFKKMIFFISPSYELIDRDRYS